MKIKSTIHSFSFLVALATGTALVPALTQAAGADRGHQKNQYSQPGGKHHSTKHGYDKHNNKHQKHYQHGRTYSHYQPRYYQPHHGHEVHRVTNYVVRDHGHHDNYVEMSNLRLMIGLHTNNLDIMFRD